MSGNDAIDGKVMQNYVLPPPLSVREKPSVRGVGFHFFWRINRSL